MFITWSMIGFRGIGFCFPLSYLLSTRVFGGWGAFIPMGVWLWITTLMLIATMVVWSAPTVWLWITTLMLIATMVVWSAPTVWLWITTLMLFLRRRFVVLFLVMFFLRRWFVVLFLVMFGRHTFFLEYCVRCQYIVKHRILLSSPSR
jgi:hypothetical protein